MWQKLTKVMVALLMAGGIFLIAVRGNAMLIDMSGLIGMLCL